MGVGRVVRMLLTADVGGLFQFIFFTGLIFGLTKVNRYLI